MYLESRFKQSIILQNLTLQTIVINFNITNYTVFSNPYTKILALNPVFLMHIDIILQTDYFSTLLI